MKVLVTGASGYVGRQLADRLLQSGHQVVCMVRKRSTVSPGAGNYARIVEADALRPETLDEALAGVEVAYYLIHSMSGRETGFDERDREAAYNFAVAAKKAGVQRVIYLGGLAAAGANVSQHLKSRHKTGAVLRKYGPPLIEFRAGIIVGNGSISFEIIRCLTERLPVMICPRWVVTRTQPFRPLSASALAGPARPSTRTGRGHDMRSSRGDGGCTSRAGVCSRYKPWRRARLAQF